MSDTPSFGFGNFVPGFDFLKNLTQGPASAMPQMPGLSNWVAPTLSVEELDKRIQELKTVQFWLDQNSRALTATVQALEVQKMTLATLKGMNVSMNEVAKAFQFDAATSAPNPAPPAAQPSAQEPAPPKASADAGTDGSADADATTPPPAGVIDPMQWWGSLTNQFQQIAATAMQDAARHASPDAAPAADAFKTAAEAAGKMAAQGVQTLQEAARAATAAAKAGAAPAKTAPRAKAAAKAPTKAAAPKAAASKTAASRKTASAAPTAAPRTPRAPRKPAA
jgi:hypothetical protein